MQILIQWGGRHNTLQSKEPPGDVNAVSSWTALEKQGSKEQMCKKIMLHLGNFKFALLVNKIPKI